jgi:uncharacterized cupin superfamily protein
MPRFLPLGLAAVAAVFLLGFGVGVSWRPAAAADASPHIAPVPLNTPLTDHLVYPPSVAVGNFDGAYTEATVYKSGIHAGDRVAFWASEAGALRATSFPRDEFVYVLEGSVVTTDADGTQHEFHPGDAFVIPKGWVGLWDMKTGFKKLIVNF